MGLKKFIYNEAEKEAQKILTEAKEEKEALLKKLNEKTDIKIANLLSNAEKENKKEISLKKLDFEHEKKRIVLEEKNTQIERVLSLLKDKLQNLNDADLFAYTVKSIKNQNIVGNEILQVNEKDYNRYLKLFSSATKKADLVELDLLNKSLGKGFNLKLEGTPALISDGFMLIGEIYDLNFSIEPQIERVRRDYGKVIEKILYE